jgi:hypothetical protein
VHAASQTWPDEDVPRALEGEMDVRTTPARLLQGNDCERYTSEVTRSDATGVPVQFGHGANHVARPDFGILDVSSGLSGLDF